MAAKKKPTRMIEIEYKFDTIEDLIRAHERIFNRHDRGEIDSKTADAMNTTMKGPVYLKAKLPADLLSMYIKAQIKKIPVPPSMIPRGLAWGTSRREKTARAGA